MARISWDNFWEKQKKDDHEIMRINSNFFAEQIEHTFSIKSSDKILDYGCGPGFMIEPLLTKNICTTGVDINRSFVEQCQQKYRHARFFLISTDLKATEGLLAKNLNEAKFDYIVLLSITQYLPNVAHLDSLVGLLTKYLSAEGRIILADIIDQRTSIIKDSLSLIKHSIRQKRIIDFVSFGFHLLLSDYRKISRDLHLLKVSSADISSIAKRYSLDWTEVSGLTIHWSRTNYVLKRMK